MDTVNRPTLPPICNPFVSAIIVNMKGVQKLLNNLKVHKAAGPDKIPTMLLKLASEELSPDLAKLSRLSIDLCKITDY